VCACECVCVYVCVCVCECVCVSKDPVFEPQRVMGLLAHQRVVWVDGGQDHTCIVTEKVREGGVCVLF